MAITTILFDLDGTLLPMDQDAFTKGYFQLLAAKLAPHGYEPKQLVEAIWAGTKAMVKNTGAQSNEEVFWKQFSAIYGAEVLADKPLFDSFYRDDFQKSKAFCGYNPKAAETVRALKAMGYRIALATNPIFPAIATESRICWTGLAPSDFELYTTYENTSYCKPNVDYYWDILRRMDRKPEECLMVGNDATEDMVAETIGMQVFLLTDCLINREHKDICVYPRGSFDQLLHYVSTERAGRKYEN